MILDFLKSIYETIGKLKPVSNVTKSVLSLAGTLLTKEHNEPALLKTNYDASVLSWKRNDESNCGMYSERGIRLNIRSWRNKRK